MMRYSSSRIQQDTRLVSIDNLIDMVDFGRLDPNPASGILPNLLRSKKSQFIESFILGLPTEMIWAQQNDLGKTQLLSGFEVLSSILDFKNDELKLNGLRVLKHLDGLRFSELDYVEKKHFMQMDINFGVILNDSDPMLRCLFVEHINRDRFGIDSAQLARNIIFNNAAINLEKYAGGLLPKFSVIKHKRLGDHSKNRMRYLLRLQVEILHCLLLIYIDKREHHLRHDVLLESYSYSRSHISKYADYESVEISLDDDLDNAINKLMFILEVDNDRMQDEIKILVNVINEIFDMEELSLKSIGSTFSFNIKNEINDFGLFERFYSCFYKQPLRHFKLNRSTKVYNLYERRM